MPRSTIVDRAIAQLEQEIAPLQAQIDAKREAISALRRAQQTKPTRRKPAKKNDVAALPLDGLTTRGSHS